MDRDTLPQRQNLSEIGQRNLKIFGAQHASTRTNGDSIRLSCLPLCEHNAWMTSAAFAWYRPPFGSQRDAVRQRAPPKSRFCDLSSI